MGNNPTYVKYTGTKELSCEKDADCYVMWANAGVTAATTPAEKEKRCCRHIGVVAEPTGTTTQIAAGNL